MYKFMKEANEQLDNYLETIVSKKSKIFYHTRVSRFFTEYMSTDKDKPINAITYHDINSFLKNISVSQNERLNYYNAFLGFFKFTYKNNSTLDVMKDVEKPIVRKKKIQYIDSNSLEKMISFTKDKDMPIEDRLLIGFFIYTGLSRQYIANLLNYQIITERTEYALLFNIGEAGEIYLPIKEELINLVLESREKLTIVKPTCKVFDYGENYFSTKVANLSKKITGKRFIPTHFSSTFIKYALKETKDIYTISKIVLESINTIEKHIEKEIDIFARTKSLLKNIYKEL